MSKSIIKEKSFDFAVRIVNLYKLLVSERKEFVMSKQMLRSGTSIGANTREAVNAQSPADFVHKFSVCQKECNETMYWLELLKATAFISEAEFNSIYADAEELYKIITSIIITSKKKVQ